MDMSPALQVIEWSESFYLMMALDDSPLEKACTRELVDYFKAEAAFSKSGPSEKHIDLAAKDLVCLPLEKSQMTERLHFTPHDWQPTLDREAEY